LQHQQHQKPRLTAEEVEVRIWGFVVIAVTLILCFIVVALLYSVTFVTQPIKSMAPIDQAYTKMLNDIVLLVVGGIGGVMSRKGVGALAEAISSPSSPPPCPQMAVHTPVWTSSGALPAWVNPALDESWTPGPPPTTPPDYIPPEAAEIAHERALAKDEA
jgi:hypothetical protein